MARIFIGNIKGVQGEPGTAATIEIGDVETGEAGTEASVTNSGTEAEAIFDFIIPKGEKGEKGDQGEPGTTPTDCEFTTNKVTTIDENSTDDQYPSAKCVYTVLGNIETVLNTLNSGGGVE